MRKYLYLAAAAGATGVAMGAFGAHALKPILTERGSVSTWNTAVLYHLIHAPALLAASLYGLDKAIAGSWFSKASACWTIGIGLFSGSLYWLALGGPRWLGPVTPIGGVFLMTGWLCVLGGAGQSPLRREDK